MTAEAGGVSGGGHWGGRRRGEHWSRVGGEEWSVGLGTTRDLTLTSGLGRFLWVQPDQVGGGPKCGSGALDVQNEVFSLINRLKPSCGILWPNFNEPECLLANCSKRGVCQQTTITLDVRQTIFSFFKEVKKLL